MHLRRGACLGRRPPVSFSLPEHPAPCAVNVGSAMQTNLNGLPEPLFERTVQILRELTSISSPSGDLSGLRRMAGLLSEELDARGLKTEIREEPGEDGAPLPVLVSRGPNTERGYLLLIGHMDTVLSAAEPRIEGDRMLATGAIDMKGGLAAFLGAL